MELYILAANDKWLPLVQVGNGVSLRKAKLCCLLKGGI